MRNSFSLRRPSRLGFTLIELIVTVTIIAILVSISVTTINRVRESARKVACASNLRQLGMAILAYANSNKNAFPQYNNSDCYGWPYIFGDWGTGYWGRYTDFYASYLPGPKNVYFCPDALRQHAGTGDQMDESWKSFPNKPPAFWILSINYCYFAGANELRTNLRGGPRSIREGTSRSTLLADSMKFGAAPTYSMASEWNHRGGVNQAGVLNGRAGGNLAYMDGHVGWMSEPAELMRHRQKINSNDNRSYVAEQTNDP